MPLSPEEQKRVCLLAGEVLLECQRLEYGMKALLFSLSLLGAPFDNDTALDIVEGRKTQSLGQVMRHVSDQFEEVSPALWEPLERALTERNRFVHGIPFQLLMPSSPSISFEVVLDSMMSIGRIISLANEAVSKLLMTCIWALAPDDAKLLAAEFGYEINLIHHGPLLNPDLYVRD